MNQRLFSVLCPLLFLAYPAIFLFAGNANYIPVRDLFSYLSWGSALTVLALGVFYLIVGSLLRASFLLVVAILTLIFYQYPAYLLKGLSIIGSFDFELPNIALFILWTLLAFRLARFGLRAKEESVLAWQKGLCAMALSLTALSLWQLIESKTTTNNQASLKVASFTPQKIPTIAHPLPSIIYIVLDGFGRSDLLSELYKFDNSELLTELKKSGFYIAEQSLTNYPQTLLSLSSSLNGDYLQNFLPDQVPHGSEREILNTALKESAVVKALNAIGYSFTSFASGLAPTSLTAAPTHIDAWPTNAIIEGLAFDLRLPLIGGWLSDYLANNHRSRILGTFEKLSSLEPSPSPQFIFAHIISPHPPFVFDENGGSIALSDGFTVADGVIANKDPNYRVKYSAQAKFIAKKTIELVQKILAMSPKPIIIIQGDHGPGSMLDWEKMNSAAYRERYPILNAYYLPNQDYSKFYPSISPVNSFRVIFNTVFGTEFEILSDHHYYAAWDTPLSFTEISDSLKDLK